MGPQRCHFLKLSQRNETTRIYKVTALLKKGFELKSPHDVGGVEAEQASPRRVEVASERPHDDDDDGVRREIDEIKASDCLLTALSEREEE